MCFGGGGSSGPSAAELRAQDEAAAARATAEANKIKVEQETQKAAEDAKQVAAKVDAANQDMARRIKNRTLLSGIAGEENTNLLEDPNNASTKKAKRSTLLQKLA